MTYPPLPRVRAAFNTRRRRSRHADVP